ncbi:MAG: Flp pilus assembly protein CpaB [Myxococcota bacterium]
MQRQATGGGSRALVFLAGSLVMALIAAAVVFSVIRRSQQELQEASKPVASADVVFAARDLYMGLPLAAEDLIIKQVTPEMVPESTFGAVADVLGRTPRERILANEMIREERLARPDAGIGLNAIVTPGKRAMTVATDTETAVAGLLQPGNYIDIIVTIAPEDPSEVGAKWVTETILQGIKVLAVGSTLGGGSTGAEAPAGDAAAAKAKKKSDAAAQRKLKPSITLEVTPEEAEKLALAGSRGQLCVVLRSDIDILQIDTHSLQTAGKLIGFSKEDAAADSVEAIKPIEGAEKKAAPVVKPAEVIEGGSKTRIEFKDGKATETNQKRKK